MTSPGPTLPVIVNHHRHRPPANPSEGESILQLSVAGDALVVDAFDVGEDNPSRAIAEMLALAAAAIDPEAAKDMLGLEINVTSHSTELVLRPAGPDPAHGSM